MNPMLSSNDFSPSVEGNVENLTPLETFSPSNYELSQVQLEHIANLPELQEFKLENWNSHMTLEQHESALQGLEVRMAEIQHRDPVRIVASDIDSAGGYSAPPPKIEVNISDLKECNTINEIREMRDTIIHEGFHAYQDYAIHHPWIHQNKAELAAWQKNWEPGNYISPQDDPIGYRYQPIENSAWEYAANVNNAIGERLGGEGILARGCNEAYDRIIAPLPEFIAHNRPLMRAGAVAIAHQIGKMV